MMNPFAAVDVRPDTLVVVGVVAALAAIVVLLSASKYIAIYVQCRLCQAPISFTQIVLMRLRRVVVREVAFSLIRANKAGLDLGALPVKRLETHALAKGRPEEVVTALITLKGAGIPATWDRLAAADLAGRDVVKAAEAAVRAKAAGVAVSVDREITKAPMR